MLRIVQLTDIHLSASNRDLLNTYYIQSLIKDLIDFHSVNTIDIILITGDLVDKGGESLGENPYEVFEELFISPMIDALKIKKDQVLFIPGNHDVQREFVKEDNEYFLANTLTKEKANEKIKEQKQIINDTNRRIEKFKEFEKKFHEKSENYSFSYNESLKAIKKDETKIGIALINDSWRCSSTLKQEQHFIGINQLHAAKSFFNQHNTSINIVVFHHPLEAINQDEKEDIEGLIQSLEFDVAFFGHTHKYSYESVLSSVGGIIKITGRTAFNNPNESQSKYQLGYNIFDIDVLNKEYTIHARKYISNHYRFDKDVEFFPNGEKKGVFAKKLYVPLSTDVKTADPDLPNGYKADVDKIVKLLIGKSLYPNQYVFVRELIQNSVDACNRVKETRGNSLPKIFVHLNSSENSFEIIDEGDGMSKKVIMDHFSIIGRSISQEFNESLNEVNLISQFGIGFISSFIVAQKIQISTRSELDGIINFEINDVFKGFDYNNITRSEHILSKSTGTSIKIFLKYGFHIYQIQNVIRSYCRHISQLEYYVDGIQQMLDNTWNIDNAIYTHKIANSKFECQLAISNQSRNLVSSNGGFLINYDAPQLIPFNFPSIIGGEVVFRPKAIDLDLSRSNVIDSNKSLEFRKDISISLRILFRKIIDSAGNEEEKRLVLNYLRYYLSFYDSLQTQIEESYSEFYSKAELIKLCADLITNPYDNFNQSLSTIIAILGSKNIRTVYYYGNNGYTDLDSVVVEYLRGQGNIVLYSEQILVQFRDGGRQFSSLSSIEIIVRSYGFDFINVHSIVQFHVGDIIVDSSDIPSTILDMCKKVEQNIFLHISIAHLGSNYKVFLQFSDKLYINFDHSSFQDLMKNFENLSSDQIEIYLLGLLDRGLSLSSVITMSH